jgi:hypothetical protein
MVPRMKAIVLAALVLSIPVAGHAAIGAYTQNFENLVQADPNALAGDGWLVFGNVFSPSMTYLYGYGPFPAPNPGAGFCAIDAGQGGAEQGVQQLSVYSDYNNLDHAQGRWIESNVYREQTIGAADVGARWKFQFDAKLGNLVSPTQAIAFIKTLDPSAGYATTNFIVVDTDVLPPTWGTYSISIDIAPALVGQLIQIGFANTATQYVSSGVFYDNITWQYEGAVDVPNLGVAAAPRLDPPAPNPSTGIARMGFSIPVAGRVDVSVYDVLGRHVATLARGDLPAGARSLAWDGRTVDGVRAAPGVYRVVLRTEDATRTRNLILVR